MNAGTFLLRSFVPDDPAQAMKINCGRGLAPDSGLSAKYVLADTLQSGQAPSHILIGFLQ
ncbi:hypothetical protein C4J96_4656 [Pseudomonas orientalis]|nr:hypothetical protein C4J96_4656 [Pseudomonas orientalis]